MARPRWGPLLVLAFFGPGTLAAASAAEPAKPSEPVKKVPAAAGTSEAPKKPAPKPSPSPAKPSSAPAAKKATPEPAKKAIAAPPPERPGSLPALEPPDPRHAQGTRKIEARPEPPKPEASEQPAEPPPKAQKGKPGKGPQATLPPGTAKRAVDTATRRQIAGGATDEEIRSGKDDPELSKLREAERVLFPRPLPGLSPGFSWELPAAPAGVEASNNGLPPEAPQRLSPPPVKDAEWLRGLSLPNLPLRYDERVLKYLKFYRDSPSGRAVAKVWAKKSGKYEASLRRSLSQAGMPSDLVWLSLIESGHNPTIASPVGAVGLWQFMPDTARTYGLTVDRWVDERLDPERATEAALRFLSDLYRRFGSWDLAMAAYNMGHGGLARAVKKFNTNDFWELARHEAGIPWETTLYVPKILATSIVMNNKKAFGLDGTESDPPESFDVVEVGPGLALSDIARSLGLDPEALERMNPKFLAGRTPPVAAGRVSPAFKLKVPRGTRVPPGRLFSVDGAHDEYTTYSVQKGDTAASIARATGTSEILVRSVNRIGSAETLAAGTLVLVPRAPAAAAPRVAGKDEDVVVVARNVDTPPDCVRVFYPVAQGDTLAELSLAFGVQRSDLLAWNALDPAARLQEGMVLQVFPKASFNLTRVRVLRAEAVRVLVAGTAEFFDFFEGINGKRRVFVTVKNGDTLASIGRRYGTSVGWMERINRRSRSDRLSAGETVVVYADRTKFPAPARAAPARPAELDGQAASVAVLETGAPGGSEPEGEARKVPSRVVP